MSTTNHLIQDVRYPRRYLMVVGTFFIALLLYVDRACISTTKEAMGLEMGWTDTQIGWVMSIFTLGYALFQTPTGWLADRFGPRRVLTAIIATWSVFTALTGLARSYMVMLLVRFGFGASEAGAFPAMARTIYAWIPVQERGIVQGINFSGSRLGAAFALPLVAYMTNALGWRSAFIWLGVIGLSMVAIWWVAFRDRPEEHAGLSEKEQAFIAANRQAPASTDAAQLSLGSLFGSSSMWLAMGQYFCSNFTFFFTLSWLFPHLKERFALELVETGFYAMAPLLAGALGNWFSGWWVDRLYRQGRHNWSRRLPAMVGFALASIGLLASLYVDDILWATVFLSVAIFGADMSLSPSWSFCIDIGRNHAGTVSGTMNMAGNLGAFLTALAFPYLQAWTGSTEPFFYVAAGLNVLAIFFWSRMRADQTLFDA